MKSTGKEKYLLLKTVQEKQILPITSICNLDCIFCSHKQNPPDIITYSFGHLDLELIDELIDYLPEAGPVILGESATKIIEGEPLLHPDFEQIINLLRRKFPDKLIKITTNGSLLTEKKIIFLKKSNPVEPNISINCNNPEARFFLMDDHFSETVFKALDLLELHNLRYHGSIVVTPYILEGDRLEKTVALLERKKACTVRIFSPGVTKYNKTFKFDKEQQKRLSFLVNNLKSKYSIPVIKEPPDLKDFKIIIQGIIKGSPADRGGLKVFDQIKQINNYKPLTRVDAFNKLKEFKKPEVIVKRGCQTYQTIIKKEQKQKSGIVVDYDLSVKKINQLKNIINKNKNQGIVIITSILAEKLIRELIKKISSDERMKVVAVKNRYFGGSIKTAGLLVTGDIITALEEENIKNYNLVVLPGIIYGLSGNDLSGDSYHKIADKFNIRVKLI